MQTFLEVKWVFFKARSALNHQRQDLWSRDPFSFF